MNNRQENEVRTSFDRNTGANANATMNLKRSWNKKLGDWTIITI
jgi:hypothetical protein